MKSILFASLLFGAMALTSCGKSAATQRAAEGNAKIDRMNEISRSLSQADVMVLSTSQFEDSVRSLEKMDDQELAEAITKLEEYSKLSTDVVDIMNSKDIESKLDPSVVHNAGLQAGKLAEAAKKIRQERKAKAEAEAEADAKAKAKKPIATKAS